MEILEFDLCININGFGEMGIETTRCYLTFVDNSCRNFFTKNAVCNPIVGDRSRIERYWWSKSIDFLIGAKRREKIVSVAINKLTGLPILPQIIDVFDGEQVEAQLSSYIEIYRPGPKWEPIGNRMSPPWTYYLQVAYVRND